MCALKSLYFPGTSIYSPQQYPMFLLPLNIQILQPVENVELAEDANLADSFIKNGFCQGYTPKPLGEDRDRFLRLLGDIQNRKDDYAAQLSSLTIAAMSGADKNQVESRNDIISSLLTGQDSTKKEKEDDTSDLWRARLILKLAEMLDREEEELSRNLSILEDYEAEILQELQGAEGEDEDNPFADLQQLNRNMVSQRTGAVRNRLNAWKQLTEKAQLTEDVEVFITDSDDAAGLLLEAFHECENNMPEALFSLALPSIISWDSNEVAEQVTDFRSSFENSEALSKMVIDGIVDQNLVDEWDSSIENVFPKDTFGRKQVSIYHFAGYSCFDLMNTKPEKSGKTGVLIAIDSNR